MDSLTTQLSTAANTLSIVHNCFEKDFTSLTSSCAQGEDLNPQSILARLSALNQKFASQATQVDEQLQCRPELVRSTLETVLTSYTLIRELQGRCNLSEEGTALKGRVDPFGRNNIEGSGDETFKRVEVASLLAKDMLNQPGLTREEEVVANKVLKSSVVATTKVAGSHQQSNNRKQTRPAHHVHVDPSTLEVSEAEFLSLTPLMRGRVKLENLNRVLTHLLEKSTNSSSTNANKPFTPSDIDEATGVSIVGRTGRDLVACLICLRGGKVGGGLGVGKNGSLVFAGGNIT
jgi:hypothetical protein